MKKIIFLLASAVLLASCTGSSEKYDVQGDTLTLHSDLLTMVDCGEFIAVDIINPWDTTTYLQQLALVKDCSTKIPGRTCITVPLKKSLIYSTVFASAIDEIGCIKAVKAVSDAEYYKQDYIISGIKDGTVIDVGSALSPNAELIMACLPDAILTSPYQNAGHGVIDNLGIPVIDMADYMETSPIGRAEWIKFIGALYGNYATADSIFQATVTQYEALKAKAPSIHPKVITECMTSGVWYVPGGNSYMAQMIRDAGGEYPWSDDNSTGSLQLDFASVYDKAHDAKFWFIKTYGYELTLETLKDNYSLNTNFDAYKNGGIYGVDTSTSTFFEDYPFHPERLLKDYIIIFAPDSLPGEKTYYYKPAKQ